MSLDPHFLESLRTALREASQMDPGPITAERELASLGLDSVSMNELIVVLEDTLDVSLELDAMKDVKTFGELQALVERVRS